MTQLFTGQTIAAIAVAKSENHLAFSCLFNSILKAYARDNCLSSLEIQNINTNTVFVPGYIEEGEHISVVLTTKNLLSNNLKQSKLHGKFLCVMKLTD